jgi:CubicO group peptidase (beta-lactamase class C family)
MLRRIGIALLLAAAARAQNASRSDVSRMDQVVQSYVADKTFMGSVLVARGDHVLLSKGYGSANLEWNIPNSPATKFRLGSVTKQFTAASILLLEERGKLKTDDPVKKYMPDTPAAWDKITIFNLLTHTSGIPNFTGFPDYRSQEPFDTTPEKLVARFRWIFSRAISSTTATRATSCWATWWRKSAARATRNSCRRTSLDRWA